MVSLASTPAGVEASEASCPRRERGSLGNAVELAPTPGPRSGRHLVDDWRVVRCTTHDDAELSRVRQRFYIAWLQWTAPHPTPCR